MDNKPTEDWSSLQTRGFLVVKRFLSTEQCARLSEQYQTLPAATDSIGLGVRWMKLPADMMGQIRDVLPLVQQHTDIKVDPECCHLMNSLQVPAREPDEALVYATKQSAQDNCFPWHTDHGTYYKVQSHAEQLNFWIPLQKTRADKSGLAVVPADTLRARDAAFAAVNPGGASVFFKCDEGGVPYVCYADCRDTAYPVRCDLDEACVCPELEAGDLLLLHMPIIHRTQDNETPRIALSYRVCLPASRLERRAAFPMNYHQYKTEEAWWDELLLSLLWFALWPRAISLERKARFLERPRRAWDECGLVGQAIVVAAAPLFFALAALKCGRSYLKRAISRRFVFGGLKKESMIGKRTPNRSWWRWFPAYITLMDIL